MPRVQQSRSGLDLALGDHFVCSVAMSKQQSNLPALDSLLGPVVKASASRAANPGFDSLLRRDFSGPSHASDLKIGTPVATMPRAWRRRVSAETGWLGVGIQ